MLLRNNTELGDCLVCRTLRPRTFILAAVCSVVATSAACGGGGHCTWNCFGSATVARKILNCVIVAAK